MSLLVTSLLKDAIIMASDSRTTYQRKDSVRYEDNTYKTILMDGRIGISHCRNAKIKGKKIEAILEDFMTLYKGSSITEIPALLKNYFLAIYKDINVAFFVAGFENYTPFIYRIYTQGNIEVCDVSSPQAFWEGERDAASRLFSPNIYFKENSRYKKHSHYPLRFNEFSIQDGIDFSTFLIETAGKTLTFQYSNHTIGGPIDILVLKRNGECYWHKRK